MTPTKTVKQYGEVVVSSGRTAAERLAETYKTSFLAAIGAGDLAVERTRSRVKDLRSRAVSLPGEAQVQADLAAKEARTRATEAVDRARTTAQGFSTSLRPEHVLTTVAGLVDNARTRAQSRVGELAQRGEHVVDELRRQPGLRTLVRRTEQAVDVVEDRLEGALEEAADAVSEASNEVTSLAQKAAARTAKVADKAENRTRNAAESAKESVEAVAEEQPAKRTTAKKTAPAAKKAPAKTTTARVTRARTARRANPTSVPGKKNS